MCKETEAMFHIITSSETNETETQGTHWGEKSTMVQFFAESAVRLQEGSDKLLGGSAGCLPQADPRTSKPRPIQEV